MSARDTGATRARPNNRWANRSGSEVILVTGGTGFVGSNLVFELASHGHRVVALDLAAPPPIVDEFWDSADNEIVFEEGSVTDAIRMREVGQQHKPTVIVHAAAVTAVDIQTERWNATAIAEANILGTVRVLDLANALRVRRVVYISSAGLYGRTRSDACVTEETPLQDGNVYLISKKTSEKLCERYADIFALDVVVGRLGQPFGPMERDTGVRSVMSPIFQMARWALRGKVVRLPLPDYTCDWTYTLDLARAVRLLVEAPVVEHRVYNLSNGEVRSLSDATQLLAELIPGATFEWVSRHPLADVDTRSDPRRGPLDISRLRDMGYEPAYDFRQGIEAALPWWAKFVDLEG